MQLEEIRLPLTQGASQRISTPASTYELRIESIEDTKHVWIGMLIGTPDPEIARGYEEHGRFFAEFVPKLKDWCGGGGLDETGVLEMTVDGPNRESVAPQ